MKKDITPEVDLTLLSSSASTPMSENVVRWCSLFDEGKLSPDMLKEYWFNQIPAKCAEQPIDNAKVSLDSLGSSPALVTELEEFIYNGNKEAMNDIIKKSNEIPSFCAKPFKNGEPSYNCKECSTDATCVMCVDCFQKSTHRHHKYRMATSTGGGFCDCGDPEAWKSDPFCDVHLPPPAQKDDSPKPELPTDLYQRCKFAFSFVIQFSLEVINKEFTKDMRNLFCAKEDFTMKYILVMYNDEVHTFDQVIDILVEVIRCTPREGLEFASKINKEGRAVITSSDFQSCSKIKFDIERLSSREGNRFLEVHVVPFSVVAYQHFALYTLNWLQDTLKTCDGFRSAVVESLIINSCDETGSSLLDTILLQDPKLWKSARMQWNLLICSGMLIEYEHKQILGIHFVKNFHSIMQNYISDDEDHPFSVACLSVQLFTVPSMAHRLIENYDALKIVVDFLINVSLSDRNSHGKLEFGRSWSYMFERASFALHDARYLLSSPPSIWSENLRTGFFSGISSFLDLLSFVEGMDAVKRQLDSHIEFEPEWETAFKLLLKIHPVLTQLYEWCASDRTVLLEVYKMILTKLDILYRASLSADTSTLFGGFQVNCIPFDATIDSVSVHLPLTRFFGVLHLHLGVFGIRFDSDELQLIEKPIPILLIEQVVRTRTMISQFRAGMWRKNGHSLASQIFFYHSAKFRGMMLDMDITVLQIGATLIDSDTFIINLLNKYSIFKWADEGLTCDLPETDSNQLRILVEEFLYLVIVLTSERYQVGVGNVSPNECAMYEMTHLLSVKPLLHSELMKAVSSKPKVISNIENVINDIALFKTSDNLSGKRHYELKEGYPPFYNPYFFHFSKEEMFKSEQTQKARHKKLYALDCCPPPVLPSFCEAFVKVSSLLKCETMLRIMNLVLKTSMSYGNNSGYEGQLDRVLFLIGLALREEEKSGGKFIFTAIANDWEIDKLLMNIYCSSHYKYQKDMMKWLLLKYQSFTNDSSIAEAIEHHDTLNESNQEQMKKSILAERARANIMAKMKSMQQKFANKNADVLGSHSQSTLVEPEPKIMTVRKCSEFVPEEDGKSVTCMLCQEDEVIAIDGRPVVLAVYVQLSTVLIRHRSYGMSALEEADSIFLSSNIGPSPYISTCGHAMHGSCFVAWRAESIRRKANSAPPLPASVDISTGEYLCPLCGCIGNAVLLISPAPEISNDPIDHQASDVSFAQWLKIAVTVLHVTKYSRLPKYNAVNNYGKLTVVTQGTSSNMFSYSASIDDLDEIKAFAFRLEDSNISGRNDTVNENIGYSISSGEGWVLNVKQYTDDTFGRELLLNRNRLPREGLHWINDLSNKIYAVAIGKKPPDATKGSPTHLWKTVAYTIHSIENNLRYSKRPLLGAFTSREEQCLENLIRMSFAMGECNQARLLINKRCLKYLSYLVENESEHPSILDWDSFGMLILLLVSVPNIVHVNNSAHIISSMGRFLQRLLLISQIAQCLFTMDIDATDSCKKENFGETDCLAFLASLVRQNYSTFNTDAVWDSLKEDLRPFLRCCTILKYFYAPKSDLCGLDEHEKDTYENMCSYLQLPVSCKELLGDEVTQSLFVAWAKHPNINNIDNMKSIHLKRNIFITNDLADLPDDYSDLLNRVRYFSCPNSNMDDSHNPTMCLICGEILCSLSYCCQKKLENKKVGACTYHAHHCGGGTGLFLKIRECQLMMFAGLGRGCFTAPPYLDEHGETDQGLRRGNQLRLCTESYRRLRLVWMTHGVYEEVSRAIEREGVVHLNSWQFF